jgi:hypothetical protein
MQHGRGHEIPCALNEPMQRLIMSMFRIQVDLEDREFDSRFEHPYRR